MLSYGNDMANTQSAKKAIRSSASKKAHNKSWEKRVKEAVKTINKSIELKKDAVDINNQFTVLQKTVDKAAKEKVIHKNKANRVKSKYAKRISALQKAPATRKSSRSTK